MNRRRQLAGVNSYTKELGFHPLEHLIAQVARPRPETDSEATVGWLDLCCGNGHALIQATDQLRTMGLADQLAIVGVDLVNFFDPVPQPTPSLDLVCASVPGWVPDRPFDLITCVHGLHYVGDKLGVLAAAAGWLTGDGLLVADLDLTAIRLTDGRPAGRPLATALRTAGFDYDTRRHRIRCTGRREIVLPYDYLGADDRAGANYTGQPAVHSHYTAQRRGGAHPRM